MIFWFASFFLAGIAGWYWLTDMRRDSTVLTPPANIADAVDIPKPLTEYPLTATENIIRSDKTGRYTINVEYPSIILATDPRAAQQASDVLRGEMNRLIERFIADATEAANAEYIPAEITSDLTVRYTPVLLTPSIIAIRFDRSAYIRGAAHPDSGASVVVYDLREHALLTTSDLFSSGFDHLGFLSGYSRDKLKEMFSGVSDEEFANMAILGTQPSPENFREVLPTPKGLTVIFNPYQVAPYARGIVSLDIPYVEVKERLSGIARSAIEEANASSTLGITEPSILMQD